MLERGTERTFATTITGKAEKFSGQGDHGIEYDLDGKGFGSQYPIKLFIPDGGPDLQLQAAYNLVLASENQKKNNDGSLPWHYYWGFRRISDGTEPVTPPSAPVQAAAPSGAGTPTAAAASAPAPRFGEFERNQSIQRQVAAKCATDMVVSGVSQDWDASYVVILDRIENGPYVEPAVPSLVQAAIQEGGVVVDDAGDAVQA